MSSGNPTNAARRSKSYAVAAVVDDDGVKTSFATSTSPVVLTVADFNGAAITAAGVLDLSRSITFTRSNNANQFSVDPIVIVGWRGGLKVTYSLVPPNDDGNDTLRVTQAWDRLETISFPPQGGAGGTYKIGVQDICAPAGDTFCAVELVANGTLNVQYGENSATTDAIPVVVAVKSEYRITPTRILTSSALSAPTSVGLTVFLP